MRNELTLPTTLEEAILMFADKLYAHDLACNFVWPEGEPICPHCGHKNAHFLPDYLRFRCHGCKKQFTVKIGSIFEDSPLPLSKWMTAVWMIVNAKNGISSWEIHRALGLTQKTAWFVLHRIREALRTGTFEKFDGTVESDETFVGGKEINKHNDKKLNQGRGAVGKAIVMGVLERSATKHGSQVRAEVIPANDKANLSAVLRAEVSEFATVYTDAWKGYNGLEDDYLHDFVDHAVRYAIGQVHTNGIENFWSLLKRCLKGTYISVEPFHLSRYVDEQAWRFNNRRFTDGERFQLAMCQVAGKRLDYATLTSEYAEYRDRFGV
jgi:transposase-like protein